ncbi:MAG: hypothetical protein JOZ84_02750 [Methylobacteriaceae bacterium]|nr:hypothetical protein [Methylobacteriaceae bacterium]
MIAPSGIGLWIVSPRACAPDDASLIERCRQLGASWAAIRSGDSGSIADQSGWSKAHAGLVRAFLDARISPFTWHYSRPSIVASQAAHVAANKSIGVVGHIVDAETEFEVAPHNDITARALMAAIRSSVGEDFFIAHAPFAFVRIHSQFPYATFGERCNAVMPQAYWSYQGHAVDVLPRIDAQWDALRNVSPAAVPAYMPIGCSYGSAIAKLGEKDPPRWDLAADDVATFLQRYRDQAPSLYSLDVAEGPALAVLSGYVKAAQIAFPTFDVPCRDPIDAT